MSSSIPVTAGVGPAGGGKGFEVAPAPAKRRRRKNKEPREAEERERTLLLQLPDVPVYANLLDFERKVDAALARRRLDMEEAVKRVKCEEGTLRISIFATPSGDFGGGTHEGESWTLHIQGRVVQEREKEGEPGVWEEVEVKEPAFSELIRMLEVTLDPYAYPGKSGKILWDSAKSTQACHGFEIKRVSVAKDVKVTVRLLPRLNPERLKLSPRLAALVGRNEDTKANVIASVWEYIRLKGLLSMREQGMIEADDELSKLMGEKRFKMNTLPAKILRHLSRLPPVEMGYTISHAALRDDPANVAAAVYDLKVSIPRNAFKDNEGGAQAFAERGNPQAAVAEIDTKLRLLIDAIKEHRRRRLFFLGFSESPYDFIKSLTQSQMRDLKKSGDHAEVVESTRKSAHYKRKWMSDAVLRYIHRRIPKSDMPE